MKVKMCDYYKDVYTISEVEQARRVIKAAKEDTATAKEYAARAIREVIRNTDYWDFEILKAEATATKNNGIEYGGYCDGSGYFDVNLEITAELGLFKGFLKVWANVSDIWQIDGEQNIAGLFEVFWYKPERN